MCWERPLRRMWKERQLELLRYLVDGAHDLPGLLVQGVGTPVRVEQVQLLNQPVVLSQEERVQRDHSQMFVSSGITWEALVFYSQTRRNQEPNFSLTRLETGSVVALRSAGAVSGAARVQLALGAGQEGHVGQTLV